MISYKKIEKDIDKLSEIAWKEKKERILKIYEEKYEKLSIFAKICSVPPVFTVREAALFKMGYTEAVYDMLTYSKIKEKEEKEKARKQKKKLLKGKGCKCKVVKQK